jgi:hypothetical protein
VWDREPQFLSWKIKTWEHAALCSNSFGSTSRVVDSKRLLPKEITAPIYEALIEVEKSIFRLTDPLPPFEARLLRENKDGVSLSMPALHHEGSVFGMRLVDLMPDWDAKVRAALGARVSDVNAKISNFATLGIPRGDFEVSYGYRVEFCIIKGSEADRDVKTHRALLMGCSESPWPPGDIRDAYDAFQP